jgi:hypothetical protein
METDVTYRPKYISWILSSLLKRNSRSKILYFVYFFCIHPLCTSITTRTVIKYNVQLWCWKGLNKIMLFIIVTNPKKLQTEVWHIEYVQCANKFSWQDTLVPITCLFYGRHTVLTQAHTNNDIILVQRGPFLNIFWWWISCRLGFQFISPCY